MKWHVHEVQYEVYTKYNIIHHHFYSFMGWGVLAGHTCLILTVNEYPMFKGHQKHKNGRSEC